MEVIMNQKLKEFEKAVKAKDWYYGMSDDNSVYLAGKAEGKHIDELALELVNMGLRSEAEKIWNRYAATMPFSSMKYRFPVK